MTRVGVLGASGFVGSAVVAALRARGADVVAVRAPRLTTRATDASRLRAELARVDVQEAAATLREELAGVDVVVNTAGVAEATSGSTGGLLGANALLPAVVAEARPLRARLVHVSSAAVQGRRAVLDESGQVGPFSPYSESKALGELMLEGASRAVIFRPTSVHGRGRRTTASLIRVLSSRLASVAGPGDRPTPQVLLANTADAIAFVALCEEEPPHVVLQPGEGLTTGELVRLLGGREPLHVPVALARVLVGLASQLGRVCGRIAGLSRRLEMLWFGQQQVAGWLAGRWVPPVSRDGWEDVA